MDYKQVILVRTDLKMSKGKVAAQVAHASTEATLRSDDQKIKAWRAKGMKKVVLKVDGSCNQQINSITPNKANIVNFLYFLLEKNKNVLIRFAGAGGMQMLNKKDFSNLKFKIPSLSEQQKIAEFLTSLDKLIESKQKQIVKAEEWKKGLMQGLFV